MKSHEENAGKKSQPKNTYKTFDSVAKFLYLRTKIIENFVRDYLMSRLNTGNVC
jgi:hypothetical protein